MAYGDVDYLEKNNINCEFEDSTGKEQRAVLTVDGLNANTLSSSRDGNIATSYEDNYRVAGNSRVAENIITALPTGLSYFVFDPTAITDRAVFALPPRYKASDGVVTITFYEDTDYTGTTDLATYNPNRTTAFAHLSTLKSGATGTDLGDYLYAISVGSATVPAVSGAGSSEAANALILDITKKYLVAVNNLSGAAVQLDYAFQWFEIPIG